LNRLKDAYFDPAGSPFTWILLKYKFQLSEDRAQLISVRRSFSNPRQISRDHPCLEPCVPLVVRGGALKEKELVEFRTS